MPDSQTHQAFRYSAFISYSHLDTAFARRLHRRLEAYRLPRHLAQGRTDATRRLKPIFRDRDELPAAPDLSAAVRAAIAESPYLIVICSRHAQNSAWVAREIALFREIHGDHAILAALTDGCSDADLHHLLAITSPTGQTIEPLAADFRRHADGPRLALLKLVATLSHTRLDQLIQRDSQRRLRQTIIAGISACIGVTAMATLTLMTMHSQGVAEREHARGNSLLESQLTDLRNRLKAVGRLDILDALNQSSAKYYGSLDISQLSAADLMQRAKLLQNMGQDDESHGDLDAARAKFQEAWNTTKALLAVAPNNADAIFDHAQSEYWLGENAWRVENYELAKKSYLAYAMLADQLVQQDSTNSTWLMEQGYTQSNLGTFVLRRNIDLKQAEAHYTNALASFHAAEHYRPGDTDILRETADTFAWLGDVKRLEGDCESAAINRERMSRLLVRVQGHDAQNADIKSAMVSNLIALARIDLCRSAPALALKKLSQGHGEAVALYEEDRSNEEFREQVRIIELFEVQTWLTLPSAARPATAEIVHTLGDCNVESTIKNNDELATYCSILWNRLSATFPANDARRNPSKTYIGKMSRWVGRLSPLWGLDFRKELAVSANRQ